MLFDDATSSRRERNREDSERSMLTFDRCSRTVHWTRGFAPASCVSATSMRRITRACYAADSVQRLKNQTPMWIGSRYQAATLSGLDGAPGRAVSSFCNGRRGSTEPGRSSTAATALVMSSRIAGETSARGTTTCNVLAWTAMRNSDLPFDPLITSARDWSLMAFVPAPPSNASNMH
jgi:hypothetical protein